MTFILLKIQQFQLQIRNLLNETIEMVTFNINNLAFRNFNNSQEY